MTKFTQPDKLLLKTGKGKEIDKGSTINKQEPLCCYFD